MKLSDIQPLTDPSLALSIYDKVFSARTGYEIVFTSQIPYRGIIFPINFLLTGEYLNAFVAATTKIGEDAFYLSITERVVRSYRRKPGHDAGFERIASEDVPLSQNPYLEEVRPIINDWFCPLTEISSFLTFDGGDDKNFQNLDNAIYSTNGSWGLWFSNDGYAIIGGSEKFINTFYDVINKTLEEMALAFLAGMEREKVAMNYLRGLLDVKDAERLIQLYMKRSGNK